MKRLTLALLSLTLVTASLVACGGDKPKQYAAVCTDRSSDWRTDDSQCATVPQQENSFADNLLAFYWVYFLVGHTPYIGYPILGYSPLYMAPYHASVYYGGAPVRAGATATFRTPTTVTVKPSGATKPPAAAVKSAVKATPAPAPKAPATAKAPAQPAKPAAPVKPQAPAPKAPAPPKVK